MQKRAPTLANIVVIALFILSCFGLLLFLWESFGGSVPLKPKGYRFAVDFPRTLLLAEEADVRVSGVSVGHVVSLQRSDNGRNHVTIEMDHQYAPVRKNARVILRQKTLLGETYVEILPGPRAGPYVPEGGELSENHVEPIVTFDDILSAFNAPTRRYFQEWQQAFAAAYAGEGEQLNSGFAELTPFVDQTNRLVGVLAEQEGALTAVIHNTGVVFSALGERDHQFEGLIVNGEHTFSALAQASQAWAQVWREFPAFERGGRATLQSLDSLAVVGSPVLDELRPAEIQLAALTHTIKTFTPDFNNLLTGFGPLTSAAKKGLPDIKKQLDLTVPVLEHAIPFSQNLNPTLEELGRYVPELQALFANGAAATQVTSQEGGAGGPRLHSLSVLNTVNPDALALYAQRTGFNRSNPYQHSGASTGISNGTLPVFDSSSCGNAMPTLVVPNFPGGRPTGTAYTASLEHTKSLEELLWLLRYINAKGEPAAVPTPPCPQASPFTINGHTSQFPQVTAAKR